MILRPYRDEDFEALHALHAAVETAAFGRSETPPEELKTWLTAPTVNLETDVRLAFDGDELVGYVDIDRAEADPPRWWSDVRVRPGRNESTVVPLLLDWAESRASDGGILRVYAAKPLVEVRKVFEARGFRWVRASYRMEVDLSCELPSPPSLDGIDIRVAREGDERTAYDVHQESFEDSWEHTPEPYDEWQHWLENETFDRSLWFIAWDGDRAAGVSLCRMRAGVGWVGVLGVRREWRRRGVGKALLLHSFAEFKRRGLERAGLGVDAESLTGANRLYESVGMKVVRQLDFFDKPL